MKGNDLMKTIKKKKIGMVGFGHLGSSIAGALIKGGLDKSNLFVSYGGNKETGRKISAMRLKSCITNTENLMKNSDIIILAARPQNIGEFAQNHVRKDALIISFMAALPLSILNSYFDCSVSRAMCSGPETISGGRGVCTLLPADSSVRDLLKLCNIRELYVKSEEEIDAFTAGICIPPILMNIEIDKRERIRALNDMVLQYPIYSELTCWIEDEITHTPSLCRKSSLENVSTKGGISEAMVSSLINGSSFLSAVERGVERCAEIRSDICKSFAVRAA